MSRPLRIEFPGAVHHVTSRGDRREPIFRDDGDREMFLDILAHTLERLDAQVLAYCLMGNHYHLVLHTRQANLSRLMRQLNGVYTQDFNRRHGLVGHLFQGRFKAILVDRDAYLLTLCRYVERNPVAARLVPHAGAWEWSSYRAHVGEAPTPVWLDTDGLHGYLLGRAPETARDRQSAARQYAALVEQRAQEDSTLWQEGLRQQIFLGDEQFATRMLAQVNPPRRAARDVPRKQRIASRSLDDWLAQAETRAQGMRLAYREGGLTMTAIAKATGLSVSRVSRLIGQAEVTGATEIR